MKQKSLKDIKLLMELLGNPQDELNFIHVAGTNGKGSTCAFLACCLEEAGYKTGLFTSPYLQDFNERIRVNGKNISDESLKELFISVDEKAESADLSLTEFERVTAAAFLYFKNEGCDIVVLEVGIGGLNDATNIIKTTKTAVITKIGLDHVEKLGDTKEKIAFQKAGIIKEKAETVVSKQDESIISLFKECCEKKNSNFTVTALDSVKIFKNDLSGQKFIYKDRTYEISLLGKNQIENAVTAIEALEALKRCGYSIPYTCVYEGLKNTLWAGRFEIAAENPMLILDCGHNLNCMESLRENLNIYFPNKKPVVLTGIMKDKDFKEIYDEIDKKALAYAAVGIDYERAMKAEDLSLFLKCYKKSCPSFETIEEGIKWALKTAKENDTFVLGVGSVYVCGEIRKLFLPGEVKISKK